LSSAFGQFAVNSNIISTPVPKISEGADISPINPNNCSIHHASGRPFILNVPKMLSVANAFKISDHQCNP